MNANYKRPRDIISKPVTDPWKEDVFGSRKALAENFIKVLKNTSGPCVFGIDSEYGTGKTFFLTRLKEDIKNQKHVSNNQRGWCVYLNAWAYEQYNQPLVALLDALKMAEGEKPDNEKSPSKLKTVVTQIVPFFAKQAVKRAVDYALGEGTVDGFADIAGDAAEKAAEAFLETKGSLQKNIDDAQDALKEFVSDKFKPDSAPSEDEPEGGETEKSGFKSLIILIDELDRVRPDFALHFLETIKHLFDVTGVVFVIAADRKILEVSARHAFGQDLPLDGYFRRLFDTWIKLPPYEPREYIKKRIREYKLVEEGYLVEVGDQYRDIDRYSDVICNFGELPSLRFIDQAVVDLNLLMRLHSSTYENPDLRDNNYKHPVYWIAFMQILKARAPRDYETFLRLIKLLHQAHDELYFLSDSSQKNEFYNFFTRIFNQFTAENGKFLINDLIYAIFSRIDYESRSKNDLRAFTKPHLLNKIKNGFNGENQIIAIQIEQFMIDPSFIEIFSNRENNSDISFPTLINNLHTQMTSFGV